MTSKVAAAKAYLSARKSDDAARLSKHAEMAVDALFQPYQLAHMSSCELRDAAIRAVEIYLQAYDGYRPGIMPQSYLLQQVVCSALANPRYRTMAAKLIYSVSQYRASLANFTAQVK